MSARLTVNELSPASGASIVTATQSCYLHSFQQARPIPAPAGRACAAALWSSLHDVLDGPDRTLLLPPEAAVRHVLCLDIAFHPGDRLVPPAVHYVQ
ncbi:hypothetical protein DFH06DRAFT_1479726 [Mycena polygramma]|nr:hypothetical protein DFH06DRAFT_1479726 [Mycena polygramma]